VVERAARTPFIDSMQREVFAPLGLDRTTMDPSRIDSEKNRAIGHQTGLAGLPVVVPITEAGGVYASAHDLGTFLTYMAWYPTLDIGVAVLTNSADHKSRQVAIAGKIVEKLEDAGLVATRYHLTSLPVTDFSIGQVTANSDYFARHPGKTAWKPERKGNLGKYQLTLFAEPRWYVKAALAVGMPRNVFMRVRRQADTMTLDGAQLLEHEPGLSFSKTGEALDFRSDPPTWRNVVLKKR